MISEQVSSRPYRTGERFNPYKQFHGIFIPEQIVRYQGISAGAKLIYGRLCRYAGENGLAYPAVATLGVEVGLSIGQVRRYLKELQNKKLLEIVRRSNGGASNYYYFLWHEVFTQNKETNVEQMLLPLLNVPEEALSEMPVVPLAETVAEENHPQESQKTICAIGNLEKRRLTTAEEKHPEAKAKRFRKTADDEHSKSSPQTEEDFDFLLISRHSKLSPFLRHEIQRDVRRDLAKVGISLTQFLAYDAEKTTNAAVIVNPGGYYRTLVSRLAGRDKEVARELMVAQNELLQRPVKINEKCVTCPSGLGLQLDGTFCRCAMGRDLEKVERWKATAQTHGPKSTETLRNQSDT